MHGTWSFTAAYKHRFNYVKEMGYVCENKCVTSHKASYRIITGHFVEEYKEKKYLGLLKNMWGKYIKEGKKK